MIPARSDRDRFIASRSGRRRRGTARQFARCYGYVRADYAADFHGHKIAPGATPRLGGRSRYTPRAYVVFISSTCLHRKFIDSRSVSRTENRSRVHERSAQMPVDATKLEFLTSNSHMSCLLNGTRKNKSFPITTQVIKFLFHYILCFKFSRIMPLQTFMCVYRDERF